MVFTIPLGTRLSVLGTSLQSGPARGGTIRRLRIGLGVLIGAICTVLAFRTINLDDLLTSLAATRDHLGWVGLALASVLLTTYAKAARWSAIAGAGPSGGRRLLPALVIGQMMNTVGPIGPLRVGEIARSVVGSDAVGLGKAYLLGSVALEKLIDGVCVLIVMLAVLPFLGAASGLLDRGGVFWATVGIIGVAVIVAAIFRGRILTLAGWLFRRLPGGWGDRLTQVMDDALRGLQGVSGWRARAVVAGWSAVIWTSGALTNLLLFWALGPDLTNQIGAPIVVAAVLLVVTQVGGAVPTIPGRIGVFHALVVFTLAAFGIDQTAALGYAVILHLVVFGTQIVLGLGALWWQSIAGRPPTNSALLGGR